MKKAFIFLMLLASSAYGNEEDEIKFFYEFKNVFINDFHSQCVNTENLKIIAVKKIKENLTCFLVESDSIYCVYVFNFDMFYTDPLGESYIYHCNYYLATKHFVGIEYHSYLDNLDNT